MVANTASKRFSFGTIDDAFIPAVKEPAHPPVTENMRVSITGTMAVDAMVWDAHPFEVLSGRDLARTRYRAAFLHASQLSKLYQSERGLHRIACCGAHSMCIICSS